MSGNVGVPAIHRLADEIEWNDLPGYIRFRIDAGLGERDLERHLGRRDHVVARNGLSLYAGNILDA